MYWSFRAAQSAVIHLQSTYTGSFPSDQGCLGLQALQQTADSTAKTHDRGHAVNGPFAIASEAYTIHI